MPKFKALKSVAHNLAHSYLSLMNYIDDDYTVERIFQIAKTQGLPNLSIDILNKTIKPEAFVTAPILLSLDYYRNALVRLLAAENMSLEHIKIVTINISFDLNKIEHSPNVTSLELPTYNCVAEIIDINGKVHSANVKEWWR